MRLSLLLILCAGCSQGNIDGIEDEMMRAAVEVAFDDPAEIELNEVREIEGGKVRLEIASKDGYCQSKVANISQEPVRIKEVVLFSDPHKLPPETRIYGEGFSKLSQTGGTLGNPVDIGNYTDRDHYKIPQPPDALTVYNMLMLSPPGEDHLLMAFTSCHRFSGSFRLRSDSIEVVLDTENLELAPGQTWELEEFVMLIGTNRNKMLERLADRLCVNHPRRPVKDRPFGWCSWYCFREKVTAAQVHANLDMIARDFPELRYVQIDDGFQPAMGDWLITRPGFGDLRALCHAIRDRKLEAGIWLAPFIAGGESRIFAEHPDWFVQDENGKPLRSDRVGFGGWRLGPWYVLDGTHPEVQKHLEQLFRILHEDYGCTYFKLDANYWGAIHSGRHYDKCATRVEAYRRGMEAMLRGAGDSFILGCNHPMWPSLGLIDGARTSNDIRLSDWSRVRSAASEGFHRNWYNNRLWWNDPDVVLLRGDQSEENLRFRATIAYAMGGMVFSGDDLSTLPPERVAILRKLIDSPGIAARFEDDNFEIGIIDKADGRDVCLFNWDDEPKDFDIPLAGPSRIRDFWTGQDLGVHEGTYRVVGMSPRSARLLACASQPKP